MTVLSVPVRLRLATGMIFLSIPLIAVELVIATQSPWWNLPLRKMIYWAVAYGLICIPLVSWILSAKKWAYYITSLLGGAWVFSSAWLCVRLGHPTLGFFTVLLLMILSGMLFLVWQELQRSFFDPQLAWYQGLPKPIPVMLCKLKNEDQIAEMRVSRIDQDGAFVFCNGTDDVQAQRLSEFSKKKKLLATFEFGEYQVNCSVKPVVWINRGIGLGLQFIEMSPDLSKEMSDFVEVLRGEGYV